MNAQEIRSLIEQKIAGQGTNVDAGGALPAILEALVDAVAPVVIEVVGLPDGTVQDVLNSIEVNGEVPTLETLRSLSLEKHIVIKYTTTELAVVYRYVTNQTIQFVAGGTDTGNNAGASVVIDINLSAGTGSIAFTEV